ncbi:hypothetical protein FNU76_06800 [Chitinimonas arctica]|uniref:Amino acid ABC transporter substrate-binding protein n=1 Tax=Chitinimonas arctica TaxID=2594795 RepID=A0A516SD45_9NEIS|nr:hypothetical protein [Chitinimonas arctica]QDQ26082.1 hypothetical protein FNU76_06800 [Chitinimonas arctica]
MRSTLPLLLYGLISLSGKAAESLSICYDDWPPYASYTEERGHYGLTVDLLREIFVSMNRTVRFQSATQSRCLAAARAGRINLMLFGDQQTMPGWGATNVPTEFWLIGAWVHADSPLRHFDKPSQFRGQRVGMVRDYIYPEPLGSYHDWQEIYSGDAIDSLRQLAAKRVDVYFDDVFWTRKKVRSKKFRLHMLQPLVAAEAQRHIFRPELAETMAEFEREVQLRIKRGEMDLRYRSVIGISYDAVRRGDYSKAIDHDQD